MRARSHASLAQLLYILGAYADGGAAQIVRSREVGLLARLDFAADPLFSSPEPARAGPAVATYSPHMPCSKAMSAHSRLKSTSTVRHLILCRLTRAGAGFVDISG